MKGAERIARRSVLDRLIQSGEPEPRTTGDSVRMVREAVLRDVEWLLNTRRIAEAAPSDLVELQDSVYHFGLPDITSKSADSPANRRWLLRQVEDCIARFEPRLTAVRVTEPEGEEHARQIRFRVEATLRIDTDLEPIYFDTVLDPSSGRINVPVNR